MFERHHHHSSHNPWGDLVAMLLIIIIITVIVLFWCLCRSCSVIFHTMKKHPRNRQLHASFALFILLCLAGLILALLFQQAAFGSLGLAGFLQLTAMAKKVKVASSPLFLKEKANLRERVLKTSWWQDHPA